MDFETEAQPIVEKLKTLKLYEVGNYLEAIGFKKRFVHSSMRAVYLSKNLVVKRPFIVAAKPKLGKHVVPTIRFRIEHLLYMIQPRCDTKDSYGAFIRIIAMKGIDTWKDHDARNCGWYEDMPVVFDW